MIDVHALIKILQEELALLEKLINIEKEIYLVLLKADRQELDVLNASKERYIEELSVKEKRRIVLVPPKTTMRELIASNNMQGREVEAASLCSQLNKQGEKLQAFQQQNHEIIQFSLSYTRRILDIVLSSDNRTYAENGQVERGHRHAGKVDSSA